MSTWIGTSGWSYDHWQGVLYPPGLPLAERLAAYTRRYSTVELNSSYYHWPRPATFAGWRRRLPEGFRLSVKAPGALTHTQRLLQPEGWLQRIASDIAALGEKAGPLLVQLPPDLSFDLPRLEHFLRMLPAGLQAAFEFRHPSWHQEATFELLAQHGAAYCVMSGAHLPCVLRCTCAVVYVRLHGPNPDHLYAGSYEPADLDWWAMRIAEWQALGCEVYVYFNNDGAGNAVRNADALKERLA